MPLKNETQQIMEKPNTVSELFEGHPERWTKGTFARDANGKEVDYASESARSWCVLGALEIVYEDSPEFFDAGDRIREVLKKRLCYPESIASWQDDPRTTFEEMLEVVREAEV